MCIHHQFKMCIGYIWPGCYNYYFSICKAPKYNLLPIPQYKALPPIPNNTLIKYDNNKFASLQANLLLILFGSIFMFTVLLFILRIFSKSLSNNIPHFIDKRMKYYEIISNDITTIPKDAPFVVRLNGKKFRSLTKRYKQLAKENSDVPYLKEFKHAMMLTANDILNEFDCASVYTYFDQIILVFNMKEQEDRHRLNGRVQKMLTLISSYASTAFMCHFSEELLKCGIKFGQENETEDKSEAEIAMEKQRVEKERLERKLTKTNKIDSMSVFTAKIVVFPKGNEYEVLNYLIFHSSNCAQRFISMHAETYLGHKNIQNMSNEDRIDALNDKGYDMSSCKIDYIMKHGIFLKKNYLKDVEFNIFKKLSYSNDLYNFLTNPKCYSLPEHWDFESRPMNYTKEYCYSLFDL
jgi:mRNA-degrading endonuclease HigB of HigAB toxin-antitoxin module